MKSTRIILSAGLLAMLHATVSMAQPVLSAPPSGSPDGPLGVPPGSSILYDQFGTLGFGVPSQDFGLGYDDFDAQVADDFSVPDVEGWTVTQVNVLGENNLLVPTTLAHVWVYADNAGVPGTAVCTHMNQAVVDDGSGNLEIELASPCELSGSGTSYWLSVQARKDFDPDGQWFWNTVLEGPFGAAAQFENPGNGFATGCTSWTAVPSCTDDSNLDMGFQIAGTLGTGGGTGTVTRATFKVTKYYADGNDEDEITVSIDCNTGLILDQDKDLSDGEWVEFVVTDYTEGNLACTITEDGETGYSGEYDNVSLGNIISDESCAYPADSIVGEAAHECVITNYPDPVNIVIHKDWIIEGTADAIDMEYGIDLYCQASGMTGPGAHNDGGNDWHGYDYSDGDDTFTWSIIPLFPTSTCYAQENNFESYVEVDNGCGNLVVSVGNGASCTITNTVFFEGIPTLSHYGMAILALLMLGMGLVSFRRFS